MAFRGASEDGQAADGVTSKQRRTNRRKRKKIDEIVRYNGDGVVQDCQLSVVTCQSVVTVQMRKLKMSWGIVDRALLEASPDSDTARDPLNRLWEKRLHPGPSLVANSLLVKSPSSFIAPSLLELQLIIIYDNILTTIVR